MICPSRYPAREYGLPTVTWASVPIVMEVLLRNRAKTTDERGPGIRVKGADVVARPWESVATAVSVSFSAVTWGQLPEIG
jgi:hypothetical protein